MLNPLLEALREHERVAGQIYSISTADIETFLRDRPALTARLEGLDPEVLAFAIADAIGEIGILEMVEDAIRDTILSASNEAAYERNAVVPG
jgi:hypothetical protein